MAELISLLTVVWYIVELLLGVGFIIFVHELGHFLVAKLCGVKCEKFYLGFDIGGWKLFSFRRGETEYGIGILPLGGYVKMLGQDDNPTKLKEEIERSKVQDADSNAGGEILPTESELAEAQQALFNPRSYLAKSVPKRMAIISAGVIMNVIFAFLLATIAFGMGVDRIVNVVGNVLPGSAAWQANIQPGDVILQIDGKKIRRFEDIQQSVPFSDPKEGVSLLIKRPGEKEPFTKVVRADRNGDIPKIGLAPSKNPILLKSDYDERYLQPGSAAVKVADQLQCGDRIVQIDGQKIEFFSQLEAYLLNNSEKSLSVTIERFVTNDKDQSVNSKLLPVTLPPQPIRTLGLIMEMGDITTIQENSPAQTAGIQIGDTILEIDGKTVSELGGPMRLPDILRRRTGESITLTLNRNNAPKPIQITAPLRRIDWEDALVDNKSPISIPQLGIAYRVLNRVAKVEPGSPAEKAGIKSGVVILSATISPPKNKKQNSHVAYQNQISFDFEKKAAWPVFFHALQIDDPDSIIELKITDNNQDKKIDLQEIDGKGWFNADRGLIFEPVTFFQRAEGFGDAFHMGASETWDSLTMVVNVLRGMGSGKISPTNLGGPGTIFYAAYLAAKRGFATFLLFLTMLSANLAVLNVLPIPMLDGGHLVFLTYEGIRGKPADERVQIALSVIGLILLLALMIFVCGLDVQRFLFR